MSCARVRFTLRHFTPLGVLGLTLLYVPACRHDGAVAGQGQAVPVQRNAEPEPIAPSLVTVARPTEPFPAGNRP